MTNKKPQKQPTALRRTIQLSHSRLWICSIDRGWGNLEFGSLCSESRVALPFWSKALWPDLPQMRCCLQLVFETPKLRVRWALILDESSQTGQRGRKNMTWGWGSLKGFATSPYIWMRCTEYFVEMGSWGLVSDWCFESLQPCLPDTFNSAVGWCWEGGGEQFRSILRKRRISQENHVCFAFVDPIPHAWIYRNPLKSCVPGSKLPLYNHMIWDELINPIP